MLRQNALHTKNFDMPPKCPLEVVRKKYFKHIAVKEVQHDDINSYLDKLGAANGRRGVPLAKLRQD